MKSDFQEVFEEKCPHIQPIFDYFHIVKNFNDKVIGEIRKDEPFMASDIISIMDITGNPHLLWFEWLLNNHFEGIIG